MVGDSNTRATLLQQIRDGANPLAWDEFFARYGPLLYGFARRRGCSEHTAEEIVQDVMLIVFRQKDLFHYDSARGRFRDWLGVVVRNKVAEHRREPSGRVHGAGGDAPPGHGEPEARQPGPDEVWETAFEQSLFLALLEVVRREMPPRAYLAFELYTLHDLPGAQVAKYTGLSRNGVYRAHKRAMNRLRVLGASYRVDGHLSQRIKDALKLRPRVPIERSLSAQIEKTMQSRWGPGSSG